MRLLLFSSRVVKQDVVVKQDFTLWVFHPVNLVSPPLLSREITAAVSRDHLQGEHREAGAPRDVGRFIF